MASFNLSNHVALVTGGNHGIGAATARVLAECGARMLIAYLRLMDEDCPGIPEAYGRNRALDAKFHGGRAIATNLSGTLGPSGWGGDPKPSR